MSEFVQVILCVCAIVCMVCMIVIAVKICDSEESDKSKKKDQQAIVNAMVELMMLSLRNMR